MMLNIRVQFISMAMISAMSAMPASAQSVTPNQVVIRLTGDCAKASEVFVVLDGDDEPRYPATPDVKTLCRWTLDLTGKPYQIDETRFSLRFRGGRTKCKFASPEFVDGSPVGLLEFNYELTGARDLTIEAEPATLYLNYSRKLMGDKASRTVDCTEGAVAEGTATLTDVLLSKEMIDLQIGLTEKPDEDRVPLDSLIRNMIIQDADQSRTATLLPEHLGHASVDKIARQRTDLSPQSSGDQGLGLATRLKKKGLTKVRLTVKK